MITLSDYLKRLPELFPAMMKNQPWEITPVLQQMLTQALVHLGKGFNIEGNIAIHSLAILEEHVVIKGPAIVGPGCFVASHAYLRGGVFLDEKVSVGPGCEVKSSMILQGTALAHFNFVGDSLLGSYVNMEAGAVIANHYNERKDKTISVNVNKKCVAIAAEKFGALVGDYARIGANAVLSPGTILPPHEIVKRLSLVEQCP
jgi:UDP-N-acetylglucosamine diphosphorylase / glucose-1-phosphate thymidylyltransferase / UDP-N-acetylgalactosamine diphosphorylase / glucosamine-1-phosphate N-acetyltransferase / galactosamine-1-phosphate N-acetyltransferase